MNEDFLNIYVVLHDKTAKGLEGVAHNLKSASDRVKDLQSNMSKLDDQQLKSATNFGKLAKATKDARDRLNELTKARQDHEKVWASLQEVRGKAEVRAYQEDVKRLADKNAAIKRENDRANAESRRDMRAAAEREERDEREADRRAERAARDRRIRDERNRRDQIREAENFAKLMAKHRPDFNPASRGDRNNKDINAFSAALSRLTDKFHENNKASNTFYVRILGLRLPLIAVAGAFPPLIGALVQTGGLLVAVADAAALAGAALGGVLIAGIAQATPVIGLMVVAFKQLFDVVKLTGDQQKLAGQANQEATDKSLNLQRQLESERVAHLALADAQKQIVEARRDAVRNIQDLNAAEKEAYLNSQRATLGLIGSQDALARAVAGGGSALDIASAQAGVADARSGVAGAALQQGRARADAAKARREGIEGNAQVIAAQQSLITQQHQMALSAAEFANQQKKATSSVDDYLKKLAELTPAQKRLFDEIVKLRKEWKDEWGGITDPIIDSFTKIVSGISKALKDADVQKAFKSLSGGVAGAVNDSTSFFGTPEAKKLFLQVMKDAKDNLPLISRILRDITAIFGRVAVAAGPFVHVILKGIRDFFDDVEAKTRDSNKLTQFFTVAFASANAFWSVLTGILDIFVELGQGGAAAAGIDLVGQLGRYLHGIAEELSGNKEGQGKFFTDLKTTVGDLGTLLDHVLRALIRIAETGAFDALIKVLDREILPLLETVLTVAGKIIVALANFSLARPGLIRTALEITGVAIAAYKVYTMISTVVRALAAWRAAMVLTAALNTATTTVEIRNAERAAAAESARWIAMLGPIALVIAAIALVAAAIFLLDKKFHFIQPTIKWLTKFVKGFGQAFIDAKDDIAKAAGQIVDKLVWLYGIVKDFIGKAIDLYLIPYKLAIRFILWELQKIWGLIKNTGFGKMLESLWDGFSDRVLGPVVDRLKSIYGWMTDIEATAKRLLHLGQGNGGDDLKKKFAEKARAGGASEQEIQSAIGNEAYDRLYGSGSGSGPGSTAFAKGGQGPNKGVTGKDSKIISTVKQHSARDFTGWESDNAVDIYAEPNTPVYAIEDGVIGKQIGHMGGDDPLLAGMRLHLQGSNNEYYYQHLQTLNVKAGQKVKRGQIIGYSGALNHVHFATKSGDPNAYLSAAPPGKKTSTQSTPSSTPSSASMNTDPSRTPGKGSAIPDIIRAAKEAGIDPAIFLATALTESGGRYGAVGDNGTSFGPFQHHKGGALGKHDAAWANSYAALQERAAQFKRLQIAGGKGAATLQGPKDKAGYAAKVDANLDRARDLIAQTDPTLTSTTSRTKARGPGARGGEAVAVATEAIQKLIDVVPNYLTLTVQDVMKQAKTAFADKSKFGGQALVKVLTEFGGVFDQMATRYSKLLATQKHRLISSRYTVIHGRDGSTSVQDTGSDLGDARQNLSNLGTDRTDLLNQFSSVGDALRQAQSLKRNTKNKNRQAIIQGAINDLLKRQEELGAALDQNVLDIVDAQKAVIAAQIAEIQAWVDNITKAGDAVVNTNNVKIAIAKLTGIGKEFIPAYFDAQISAMTSEKIGLQGALGAAVANGNADLIRSIQAAIENLDLAITQTIADKFQVSVDAVAESANRQNTATSIRGRLNALGGNSFNSLRGQRGVLDQQREDIRSQIMGQNALLAGAPTPAAAQAILETIADLNAQLAENADAIRENTENIAQARVDQIKSTGAFRGGINSGVKGLLDSLAQGTGALDTTSLLKSLNNQSGNLKTTGAGLRSELMSQFGINLSSDPRQLIQQLNNTDFAAMEFGMDDNTKGTFEDLINSIIENATALSDNTNELAEANGQTPQDWSSSLWSTFRDALFTGNNGILGGIPQAATGAHIMSAGLVKVHAGETIVPAGISRYSSNDTKIELHIDNRGEGDVDPLVVSKRLAFELANRGK